MSRIILASASPRRRELMELAGYNFEVICADIVEAVPENVQPQEVVMSLALQKAQAVAAENEDAVVVGWTEKFSASLVRSRRLAKCFVCFRAGLIRSSRASR